jgi:RNA polymerase sigma-70 factor (ECF subfamily)
MDNDTGYFEKIYRANWSYVYRFLMRMCNDTYLAEELTQEAMLRAYINIDSFSSKSSLSTWICQIAKNLFFDYLKKEKLYDKYKVDIVDINNSANSIDNVLDDVICREWAQGVANEIKSLKTVFRDILTERLYMGLSYDEIAALHGKSNVWARVNYYRAKAALAERVKKHE